MVTVHYDLEQWKLMDFAPAATLLDCKMFIILHVIVQNMKSNS